MDFPITRTQIIVPRPRPDLLSRPRLLDLLYDILDYKLFIIAAPAGYGKTSLLVDLACHLELPVCWYSLEQLDRDPTRFIAHIIASIGQRFENFGTKSREAFQAALADRNLNRLPETIVNELDGVATEHMAVVLDDFHLVHDVPEIVQFVNQLTQVAGENCHLIISTRSLLPLPDLPLLVARSQVGGLSSKELAFQAHEIQALIEQNHHLTITERAAEELARETEGWITGLLLSAEIMWQGLADRLRVARASGVGLYDYLAQQVLDQQPAELQDFLLRTCLFEEFDAALCDAVLKPTLYPAEADLQKTMERIWKSNLFVTQVGDKGTWLRYHHLFREFLQARLRRFRPAECTSIQRQMAVVYAGRGVWEKAHELYTALRDEEAAACVIEQAELSLLANGRLTLLERWLEDLQLRTLESHLPLLSLQGGVAVVLGQVERGLSLLDRAVAAIGATGDVPLLCRTLLRRAAANRNLGHYQEALAECNKVILLAADKKEFRSLRAEALKFKGSVLLRMGALEEAISAMEESKAAYARLGDSENVEWLNMDLGLVYTDVGAYRKAMVDLNQALDYWRHAGQITWQANILNDLGVLHHLLGAYARSAEFLEEALALARQGGYIPLQGYTLASLGDLYFELDLPEAASSAYDQARTMAQRSSNHFLLLHLNLQEAALARRNGELSRAHALVESARRLARQASSPLEAALCQIEAGQLALAEQDWQGAITPLREGARRCGRLGERVQAARAYMHLAAAYDQAGNSRAGRESLKRAFDAALHLDSQHPLVVSGRATQTLLLSARDDPVIGAAASRLLERIAEFETSAPAVRRSLRRRELFDTAPHARLTIQALGAAQVLVDGRAVTNAEWQSHAARDLFFLLLANPAGLTKEAIGAVFWPEYSPAELKLHFKNTVYRLRRALGQDVVLFDEQRYSISRELDYEYDVEDFLSQMEKASGAADAAQRELAFAAAVALYKGPYLPEMDGTWVWPERERLSQACLNAMLALAELRFGKSECTSALECCQQALEIESCSEQAHRLAMRIHWAMGDRQAVVRQYKQCEASLKEEIDTIPSLETRVLFERLSR